MSEMKTAPQERGAEGMICPQCKTENKSDANFCKKCAKKLRQVCNCWVKKDLYDCGHEKCPGFHLILEPNQGRPI